MKKAESERLWRKKKGGGVQRREESFTRTEIEDLLKLKGWTQAELGRQLGMSEAAVSRWLTGEREPKTPVKILLRQWLSQAREVFPS